MTHKYRAYIAVEFKNYKVGAPMVRQIWGTASLQNVNGELRDVIVFCRGFTKAAGEVAKELRKKHGVHFMFKVVADDAEDSKS